MSPATIATVCTLLVLAGAVGYGVGYYAGREAGASEERKRPKV